MWVKRGMLVCKVSIPMCKSIMVMCKPVVSMCEVVLSMCKLYMYVCKDFASLSQKKKKYYMFYILSSLIGKTHGKKLVFLIQEY